MRRASCYQSLTSVGVCECDMCCGWGGEAMGTSSMPFLPPLDTVRHPLILCMDQCCLSHVDSMCASFVNRKT